MNSKTIEETLQDHEKRIHNLEAEIFSRAQIPPPAIKKALSLREFLLDKKPAGMYQIGLAIVYYFEKYENMSSFTREDLAEGFRQAKEPLPSNLSAVIYKNSERGLLMEAKEKKNNKNAWIITNSGEKLVEDGFRRIDLM